MAGEGEGRGEGRGQHVAAFSEIVDSLDVKGEARRGRVGGYRGEKRVCVGLRGVGGGASVCFPRLSEYGRTIV